MLLAIFILCLSHLVLASPVQQEYYDLEDMEQLKYHFNNFKVKHNRSYTAEEEKLRFQYFKENLAIINELNRNNTMTVYGINKFTDWTEEEMKKLSGYRAANPGDSSCSYGVASDIIIGSVSDAIDWRERNAVGPIQNQGTCGSCWAFSAASVLEGAYALKYNTMLKVSEQQFVDCDTLAHGCHGGAPESAITSTMDLGGQELEYDYPYTAQQQQCQFDVSKAQVKASSCKVFYNIGDSDGRLASLLASNGPLSIILDAKPNAFQNYNGGILVNCAGSRMSHAVTLIGYGEEAGTPYWIIKNSWGVEWGEGGFARIKRGEGCLLIGSYALTADVV